MSKLEKQVPYNNESLGGINSHSRSNENIKSRRIETTQENLKFPHLEVESKWANKWVEDRLYCADDNSGKEKFYVLDMFPYPSGTGIHLGHVEGYTATDILSRYKRMNGYEVLHPMGWDSFGLPTENFAIKTNRNPREVTDTNVKVFKKQCTEVGFSIDWERELDTSREEYYKWTQDLFLDLYEKGLAYKAEAPVNWCTGCKTAISNEQVVKISKCERCGSNVESKNIEQWFFKITDFAEELIEGLDEVNWPESSKAIQKNWIGKTEGYQFSLKSSSGKDYDFFLEELNHLEDAKFVVIAPESEYVKTIKNERNIKKIESYVKQITPSSGIDRIKSNKKKTGVFTGEYMENPVNKELMPVWIPDYTLATYGKGINLGIPSKDKNDKMFAISNHIEINKQNIQIRNKENRVEKIMEGKFKKTTEYKLRDWLVSRERYWGTPIPIIHCNSCGDVPVPRKDLPVKLPQIDDYKPTGVPPLARSEEFINTCCPSCGEMAKREAKTLDTFVDSAWYYLRFADPKNEDAMFDSDKLEKWLPLDYYLGGADHLTGHLMYSRFITRFLHKIGKISFKEPFTTLNHIGMISGSDGRKMSKRWGNSIKPEDISKEVGSDALRITEMFMGPIDQPKKWDDKATIGPRKFIDRVWQCKDIVVNRKASDKEIQDINELINKVSKGIEESRFNTVISDFMKYINKIDNGKDTISKELFESFLKLLSPVAPFVTEEIWNKLGNKYSIHLQEWPKVFDGDFNSEAEIPLMINGRLKHIIKDGDWENDEEIINYLINNEEINREDLKKIVYKKGKVINIVK